MQNSVSTGLGNDGVKPGVVDREVAVTPHLCARFHPALKFDELSDVGALCVLSRPSGRRRFKKGSDGEQIFELRGVQLVRCSVAAKMVLLDQPFDLQAGECFSDRCL